MLYVNMPSSARWSRKEPIGSYDKTKLLPGLSIRQRSSVTQLRMKQVNTNPHNIAASLISNNISQEGRSYKVGNRSHKSEQPFAWISFEASRQGLHNSSRRSQSSASQMLKGSFIFHELNDSSACCLLKSMQTDGWKQLLSGAPCKNRRMRLASWTCLL